MAKEKERSKESRRADEALRESEGKYRALFEESRDAIYVTSRDGRIIDVNPSMSELFGYTREEFMGLRAQDTYVDPAQRRRYQRGIEKKGTVRDYEVRLRKKDGTEMDCLVTSTVRRAEDGRVLGYQGIIRDITERKQAEEELRKSEEEFRLAFENAKDAIFWADPETGLVISCNKAAEILLEKKREEIVGSHQTTLHPPKKAEHYAEMFKKHIEEEGAVDDEAEVISKSGKIKPVHITASTTLVGGKPVIQGIFRDITERKRAEKALRKSEEKLRAQYKGIPIPTYTWQRVREDFILVDYNDAAEAITQGRIVDLLGRTAQEMYQDEPEILEEFRRCFAERTSIKREGLFQLKSTGESGYFSVSYAFVPPDLVMVHTEDITERKRAEEEIRQRSEELAALNTIAMTVTSTLDLQEVLDAIQRKIMALLDEVYPPYFFLFHEEDQTFRLEATRLQERGLRRVEKSLRMNLEERPFPLASLNPTLRETLLAGNPYMTDDLSDFSELGISKKLIKGVQRELEINSILGLALWVKGKLVAAMLLVSPRERLPEGEIELLSAIANQAAIAIENARLHEESRCKAEELAALYDVSLDVAAQLEIERLLQTVIERATRLLNARGGGIYLYDPAKREIELRASYGLSKDYTGTRLALGEGVSGKVAESGEPLVVEDYAHWGGRSPKYDVEPSMNVLGVPLKRGDEFLGVLFINHEVEKGFDEAETRLATLLANQAAIAIENARLYEQTDEKLQHRVTELTALNTIAQRLASTLELDEMLESIVTRVAQVLEARICTIRVVEGDELTVGAAVGYKDESARQHRIKIDERLARMIRDQKPLVIKDLWTAEGIPPSRRERAKHEEVHAFLGVPMISKGETIGVLSIYREEPHHFGEEEVALLSTVANQTGVAIERVRLHQKVKTHATELEHLVQERTKELQAIHAELLQSAKLAALGQLAAGVAHELNNPLGAISGYLELLQEEMELGPRETEYMGRIEKRIQQAAKIVSELRTTWIPSEPTWQVVNVNDVLEETLTVLEWRLSLQQIEVQKEMSPHLPLMHADPDQLEQVFINIIANARQAMREGGTLGVASRESRNGEWLEIIFADTGEGITKEHLNKIFDPFFTTRGPGEGMGLGLSVSHRIIKDHGGAIDVWSERGKGTVFRVALPPSGARRCWEILDCAEKERCRAVRENADYRCWSVMEDVSRCERCEVYRRKALPPLDGTLLPE